jgi:hypothetical protein
MREQELHKQLETALERLFTYDKKTNSFRPKPGAWKYCFECSNCHREFTRLSDFQRHKCREEKKK